MLILILVLIDLKRAVYVEPFVTAAAAAAAAAAVLKLPYYLP